jgi:hypothetical protein
MEFFSIKYYCCAKFEFTPRHKIIALHSVKILLHYTPLASSMSSKLCFQHPSFNFARD